MYKERRYRAVLDVSSWSIGYEHLDKGKGDEIKRAIWRQRCNCGKTRIAKLFPAFINSSGSVGISMQLISIYFNKKKDTKIRDKHCKKFGTRVRS